MGEKITKTYVCDQCGEEHKTDNGMIYVKRIERRGAFGSKLMTEKYFCNEKCFSKAIFNFVE